MVQYMYKCNPKRGGRTDKIFEDIRTEKSPNLMRTIITQSQEVKKKILNTRKRRKPGQGMVQSSCLYSVKRKILKATRGEKNITKN